MERLLAAIATALEEIPVRYAIGGSVASTHQGEPRMTNDVDVLVDLGPDHLDAFRSAFGEDWYIPDRGLPEAVRTAGSFNLIHLSWMDKVDFFVAGDEPLKRKTLERAVPLRIGEIDVAFSSAEDIVLHKLDWLRQSGGILERQRRDVLGVMKATGSALDISYLRRMAETLSLEEPLESCFRDAGLLP